MYSNNMLVFNLCFIFYNKKMQDIRKFFGSLVKKNRKLLKLTQAELAFKVGVDPKYISRIETGASYPSLSIIEKIFNVLNIDIGTNFQCNACTNKETMINIINDYLKNASMQDVQVVKSIVDILIAKD